LRFLPPQVRFLQGKQDTWYAGSYTLFNTHEIAVMSGEYTCPIVVLQIAVACMPTVIIFQIDC